MSDRKQFHVHELAPCRAMQRRCSVTSLADSRRRRCSLLCTGEVSDGLRGLSPPLPPQTLDHGPCYFSKSNQHPGTYYIPWYIIIAKFITVIICQACYKTESNEMCLLRSTTHILIRPHYCGTHFLSKYANLVTLFTYLQFRNLFWATVYKTVHHMLTDNGTFYNVRLVCL